MNSGNAFRGVVETLAFCFALAAASSARAGDLDALDIRGSVAPSALSEAALPAYPPLAPGDVQQSLMSAAPERAPSIVPPADGFVPKGPSVSDIAAAMKALATEPGAIARPRISRAEYEAVLAVYAAREFRPLWSDGAGWTSAGRSLVARLAKAEDDALEVVDYALPAPEGDAAARARADVAASFAAVAYARDARGGRIEPTRLSKNITPTLELPVASAVLAELAAAPNAGDALQAYNPPHAGYRALREKLVEMREATGTLTLKGGDAKPSPVLAVPPSLGDVIANMERWRWLPRDLGERRIEVNIPEYELRVVDGGRAVHTARVVVGTPKTQTPVFSETMEYVVVNPSWSIPQSILRKEILPRLAADPDYAARHGYLVTRNGNSVSIRQPPGERNALGFIKFMFPNQHAVYIHDTPQRKLFAKDERAFSHGCVRVDQPFALAEAVLGDTGFGEERLKGLIGKGERTVHLARPLPVHLTYFTVVVDEQGRLKRLPDIYGHDEKVRTALRQSPSRVASR